MYEKSIKKISELHLIDREIINLEEEISVLRKRRKIKEEQLIGEKIKFKPNNEISAMCDMAWGLKEMPHEFEWEITNFPGCWMWLENIDWNKNHKASVSVRECAEYFKKEGKQL